MTGTDPTPTMSQPTSSTFKAGDRVRITADLIALAEALGAVEHNSWIDAGLLCRRYITADGSIDLTVRVP